MMPAHYALSDAAIVLVTLFAGHALWRNIKVLPAFAMACFGVAASIGVVRFGGGLQDALAALHSGASQYLGLAGAFAILAHYLFPPKGRNGIVIIAFILTVALAIFWFAPPFLGPLFLLALMLACAASIVRPSLSQPSWLVPVACAVMLANTLFIRRATWMDEAVSWHAYHLIIALALAALAKGLMTTEQRVS
ncbi:hypothetical protein [Sphingorhabdus wooponensis]|uniref:Lysoplasmalogenase n=1 Tax=Sphingorhabdus wooponensis TaxID=940136 RepID=A0A3R8Q3W1_9SPHN|nr:hypothetical protein [Sphingorhabdus wooponensis]RRQ52675.1 hypothetical protein D7D48_07580 [Sphingorhabdus wooponensis]